MLASIGASFCVAGQAVAKPLETPVIQTPAAGSALPSPVTVTYQLSPTPAPNANGKTWAPSAFLVIDSALPAPGATVGADPQHVAFPKKQDQLSVDLPPGRHSLQIVLVNHKGVVIKHFQPGQPVEVTVTQ